MVNRTHWAFDAHFHREDDWTHGTWGLPVSPASRAKLFVCCSGCMGASARTAISLLHLDGRWCRGRKKKLDSCSVCCPLWKIGFEWDLSIKIVFFLKKKIGFGTWISVKFDGVESWVSSLWNIMGMVRTHLGNPCLTNHDFMKIYTPQITNSRGFVDGDNGYLTNMDRQHK